MSKKDERIQQLEYDNEVLQNEVEFLEERIYELSTRATFAPTPSPALPKAGLVESLKGLFKYERFWTVSFELNPFKWFSKPRYYRYNWKKGINPATREGQADFGPFSVFWYRDLKR